MNFGNSIIGRLRWGFGAVLGGLVLLTAVNVWSVFSVLNAQTALQTLEQVKAQVMQNQMSLGNYLLSGDTREADKVTKGVNDLKILLDQADSQASSSQKPAILAIHEAADAWQASFAGPLIERRKQVDAGNSTVNELEIFYLQQDPVNSVKKVTDAVEAAVTQQADSTKSNAKITLTLSIFAMILLVAAGFFVARHTAYSITAPLGHLIKVAREIGDSGDLDHQIDVSRSDEIGMLAATFANMVTYLKEMAAVSEAIAGGDLAVEIQPRSKRDTLALAFSKMTEGLRSLVKSVRDSASQVSAGANQVADASDESAKIGLHASSAIDEVTSTMHEMSINVQNMVKNTQTQASSVSETSASIDQMVASIQRVADTAKVLLDISQRSREEVQSGITTMEKATDGLNRINGSIQSSGEIISALGARADDIGKIIEVIDDLAEQTNLLALNAAIEAARAGEHGLGFAVVADEVRKLAEKSASSTKEISDLIQSIQKEARKAVENMERSTSIVNEGLTLGGDLNNALRKISSVVTEVYKFAQEIGAATNEQSHGSSQIAKATTRLNEITHEINSSVEEQASGAQAVVKAMEKMRELVQQSTSGSTELAASAEQMSKMSRTLLTAMDRFIIESNGNSTGSFRRSELTKFAGVGTN
jgi:methyl-accepting chemotaxis protein